MLLIALETHIDYKENVNIFNAVAKGYFILFIKCCFAKSTGISNLNLGSKESFLFSFILWSFHSIAHTDWGMGIYINLLILLT